MWRFGPGSDFHSRPQPICVCCCWSSAWARCFTWRQGPLGHFFQIAWTDSESRPRPPDVRIEIQDRSRRHTSPLGHTPIDAWIQKMDVDGDGGRRDLRMKDKPHQLRRLSIRWSSSSNDMPRDGSASNSASRRRASATPSSSSCAKISRTSRCSLPNSIACEPLEIRMVLGRNHSSRIYAGVPGPILNSFW